MRLRRPRSFPTSPPTPSSPLSSLALRSDLSRRRFLQLLGLASSVALVPSARAAATAYDDGNRDVPTGVGERPERVVVIGAGFAGLAAANALANAGVETIVLEGRDRLGGRAWTADVGGVPADLGCSWIHTPIGNPMKRWADQVGVGVVPFGQNDEIVPNLSLWDQATGGWLSEPDLLDALVQTILFEDALPELRAAFPAGTALEPAVERYLDDAGLAGDARRRAGFAIRFLAEQYCASSTNDEGLATYLNSGIAFEGEDVLPDGGYVRLVEPLARGLDVRFGDAAVRVAYDDASVTVTTASGERHRGSHAIVTVPLGCLRENVLAFDPALPADKTAAISRIGFGNFEKVVLRFAEPFWQASRDHFLFLSEERLEYPLWLDLTRTVGAPTLAMLSGGSFAKKIATRTTAEVEARVLAILAELFGPIPTPELVVRTDWANDPFSRGSYSFVHREEHYPDDPDALAAPVAGRVLFAGEASSADRFGYADGAMRTGLREAKRLLATESVELAPLGPRPRRSLLLPGTGRGRSRRGGVRLAQRR